MANKTQIVNATINQETNTCYVTYSTGTEKVYQADKLPKTVTMWLADHAEETTETNESVEASETMETAENMVTSETAETVETMETTENITETEVSTHDDVRDFVFDAQTETEKPFLFSSIVGNCNYIKGDEKKTETAETENESHCNKAKEVAATAAAVAEYFGRIATFVSLWAIGTTVKAITLIIIPLLTYIGTLAFCKTCDLIRETATRTKLIAPVAWNRLTATVDLVMKEAVKTIALICFRLRIAIA